MPIELADITDVAGCRQVVAIQIDVWGQDSEVVPASVLLASAKRGGILLGASDGNRLLGFVWSMPGWRAGQPTQWSHMLGVRPDARGSGLGERLKVAQRERALAAGTALIEWTFDPLQAQNAHLNMAVLGCVASEYRVDAYGRMAGPLHDGTPTDRLVAEWWIGAPHVVRRLAARTAERRSLPLAGALDLREVPAALTTQPQAAWLGCGHVDTSLDARRILVAVPPRFGDMQQQARELALAWRLAARTALTTYLGRGYRVVDFLRNRHEGGGAYVLSRVEPERG